MGRIRTIKPEFPHSESMGRVSRDARLLFILLWTLVDDSGRTRAASRMLASLLFPYDDDAPKRVDGWLAELVKERCVVCYEVDGASYLEVCKWREHQRIDRPSPSKFPPFDESSRALIDPSSLDLDQGPRTKDQGPKEAGRAAARPDDVCQQVWDDFRKSRKVALTETALAGIVREAKKAGWTTEAAMREATERGWRGFKADWVANGGSRNGKPASPSQQIGQSLRAWMDSPDD